jgi:DivIVA domain-containing protein
VNNLADFGIVLRGYGRDEVDAAVARADKAIDSGDPALRAAVRDELLATRFTIVLRGYDRPQVDAFVRSLVDELERPPGA